MNLIDDKRIDKNELQAHRDNEHQTFDSYENKLIITSSLCPIEKRINDLRSLGLKVVSYSLQIKPNNNDILTIHLDNGVTNTFKGSFLINSGLSALNGVMRI